MPRVCVIVLLSIVVSACGSATGSTAPSAAATSAPSVAPAGSGAACVDQATLGDNAEAVVVTLSGLDTAIKASNGSAAQASAKQAATGLRGLADLVGTAAPDAQMLFVSAANALDAAGPLLPNAATQVAEANSDFDKALVIAQAKGC
jgi:hypothetical protein